MKKSLSVLLFWLACIMVSAQTNVITDYLLEEKFEDALHIADSLILTDSSNAQMYLYRGTALRGLGKYPEAILSLQQANRLSPQINTSLLIAGLQQESGDSPAAIDNYYQILRIDSMNTRALFILGKLLLAEDKPIEAYYCFKPLCVLDSTNSLYAKYMAETWDQLNHIDSALFYYEKAIRLNWDDRNTVFRLGNMYVKQNTFQKGIQLTDTYLSKAAYKGKAEDVKILKLNAYLYLLAFNPRTSIERFSRCLELGDSSFFTYKYLGLANHDISHYTEAIFNLHKARQYMPDDPELFFFLGKCYGMINQPDTAIACLHKTIDLLNPSPTFISSIQIMIADNLNILKQNEKALQELFAARELDESPEILFMLGRQYDFFLSDPDSAELYYRLFLNNLQNIEAQTKKQHEYKSRAEERLNKLKEDRFWLGLDSVPQR